MRRVGTIALGVAGLAMSAACTKAAAKVPTDRPPLEVPVAPPRILAPSEPEPPSETLPPREAPAPAAPAVRAGRPARPAPRVEAPVREEPKPDPPPKPEPAPPPVATAPAPQLRTQETANDETVGRRVRETLDRAARTLNSVNYAALGVEAKGQYETAKRFMKQAEEALKVKNYVFAGSLAGKAETIARELSR